MTACNEAQTFWAFWADVYIIWTLIGCRKADITWLCGCTSCHSLSGGWFDKNSCSWSGTRTFCSWCFAITDWSSAPGTYVDRSGWQVLFFAPLFQISLVLASTLMKTLHCSVYSKLKLHSLLHSSYQNWNTLIIPQRCFDRIGRVIGCVLGLCRDQCCAYVYWDVALVSSQHLPSRIQSRERAQSCVRKSRHNTVQHVSILGIFEWRLASFWAASSSPKTISLFRIPTSST